MSAVLEAREPSARYLESAQPALVRQFEQLVSAPSGVERLRELILSLAVRGKVARQDPREEPASELLRRIRFEREALVAARLIKQDKPTASISSDEEPFSLPPGWAWVRFGDLIHELCTGPFGSLIHKEDYVSGGIPLINPSHMVDARIEHDPEISVSASMASQLTAYKLSVGDVLLARRGEMGRYALVTEREAGWLCGTGSFFVKLFRTYNRRFFGLTLEDPRLRRHLLGESVGATMTNLNQRILLDAVVAVAPLAEQSRIVARVDELMCLCDALEAKGRLEAAQHARLLGTLLGTLTDSSTPEELAANWQRVADHFDLLLDRPEAVDALEQTILQLAVRGLLVPQDSREAPASELLAAISAERSALVAAGELKRNWVSEPVYSEEQVFSVPTGWAWARTGDLILMSEAGWSPTCHPTPRRGGKWGVLKVSAVSWGEFDPEANKELPDNLSPRLDYEVKAGDFLLSRANTEELVARAVVVGEVPSKLMLSDKIIRLNTSRHCNRAFLCMSNNSAHTRTYYVTHASGTSSSMKNVSRDVVLSAPVALPPIAEQRRIITRVTELRRTCADLRQRLTASRTLQSQLAEAMVDEIA